MSEPVASRFSVQSGSAPHPTGRAHGWVSRLPAPSLDSELAPHSQGDHTSSSQGIRGDPLRALSEGCLPLSGLRRAPHGGARQNLRTEEGPV